MKYILSFIFIFLIYDPALLRAQSIHADLTSGCDSLLVNFSLVPPVVSFTSISWNFGNGKTSTGSTTPSVTYDEPGRYTVTCLINNTVTLTSPNLITVNKAPSSAFRYEDSLSISPYYYVFRHLRLPEDTGLLDLMWQFPGGILHTSPVTEFDFTAPGRYNVSLVVFSSSGCSSSTINEIVVTELFEAPNVFTPNNDAINDYFEIRTNDIYSYTFSVYTRSGVLIYRSESPTIIWDGRNFSGSMVTPGIYYYTVEGGGDAVKLKGIVYLLK